MFLGIEIGGTKLQLGVGPGDGTIVALERARVEPAAGAERIRQQILELVPTLLSRVGLSKSDIVAVGIGFGGPVDTEKGIVTKSHQIEGWAGFPLADWSRRELGWPTVVHNDADTAGLAEACFGAGRGYNPIFYITIGSGIGGGLIIDQQIYRGARAGAGEIGHLMMPEGPVWFEIPGAKGVTPPRPVESYCSGWSIERFAQGTVEFMRETGTTLLPNTMPVHYKQLVELAGDRVDQITTAVLAQAARQGNPLARAIVNSRVRILGWAVAQMITLICPRRVIVGGGVSLWGEDLLFQPLRVAVAELVFAPFVDCYDIVPAELAEAVVVHGALRLARDSIGNDR